MTNVPVPVAPITLVRRVSSSGHFVVERIHVRKNGLGWILHGWSEVRGLIVAIDESSLFIS